MDTKLFNAAKNNVARGQIEALREKINSNPELIHLCGGKTLLHEAVSSRRPEMVRYLLDQGADVNAIDSPHKLLTPLHYAAVSGQMEMIEILLAAGAGVNIEDKNGNSPLIGSLGMGRGFDAESRGRYEKVFFRLIESGAKTRFPERLLNAAAVDGYVNVAKYILDELIVDYPFHLPEKSRPGGALSDYSALAAAARNNRLEVVKLLLERGGASGHGGRDGKNALREARMRRHDDIAEMLLSFGVEPGETPWPAPAQSRDETMRRLEDFFAGQENPEASRKQFEDTVAFAVKMCSGKIFDEIREWRSEWVADHLARGWCAEKETRPLKEVLSELEAELDKLDDRIGGLLKPGLSAGEFEELAQGEIWPVGVAALFQWRNGSVEYEKNSVFGRYRFLSLQDALKRRAMMAEISSKHYLPIMHDGAGTTIEVDLRAEKELAGLTYEVYNEEPDSPVIFPGLNAFFGAVLACFRRGAFKVAPKAGPDGEDLLAGRHEAVDAIMGEFILRLPGETPPEAPDPEDDGGGISIYDYTAVLRPPRQ